MRQVTLTSPKTIEYSIVPDIKAESLNPHQVLLKVRRIGICGSEIHSYHGLHPATFYPVIQGHEYSAEVVAVGSEVKVCKIGDYVTARPQLVCGECNPCKRGQYNVCEHLRVQAFQADGAARDYFVMDDDRIVVLPEGMSLDFGAMIEPSAVGAHSTSRAGDLRGKNVVVSGAGAIGNLVAQFAKARGAKRVLITDVSDLRLEIAKQCGIADTMNVLKTSLKEGVKEVFGDEGFQVGFEVAGVESSIRSLMECIEKGSTIVVVAVFAKDPALSMFYLGEHELTLVGTMMYRHEDYLDAVKFISDGTINLNPLITNRFPLEQYDDAYKFIDANRETSMKVIVDLDQRPVVAGIGEIVWDMLPTGAQLGGAPLNFASHAALAGAESHIISAIGNDELGRQTEEIIDKLGLVSKGGLQKNDCPTGKVNVSLDANGVPQYDIEQGSSWDNITATPEAEAIMAKADCICWGSLAQRSENTRKAILELVSKAGEKCLKVFDVNLRQNWWSKEIIEDSLKLADVLKLNEEEEVKFKELFGVDASGLVAKFDLKYVILTKGADSSAIYSKEGLVSEIKTPKCDVVDTVGAGDSFTAAFVTSLFFGKTVAEAHQIAVDKAAAVCGHKGAIPTE